MKFPSISPYFFLVACLLSDVLEAQDSSSFTSNPIEINKTEFNEIANILLLYPSINKAVKDLSTEGNCLMYISNNSGLLLGMVFHMDSNYRVKSGYFTKFGNSVQDKYAMIPLKAKQLKKIQSIKIDSANSGHYLRCSINSVHEDREIIMILKESEINGGLSLRGNPIFPEDLNHIGLIGFREAIRNIKIPKKLYHLN